MRQDYKYLTNCELGLERDANYATRDELRKLFVPLQGDPYAHMEGTCGNVAGHFSVNRKTRKVKVEKEWSPKAETHVSLYQALPSALALYILCALDEVNVVAAGPEGYKCVWTVGLVHVESRCKVFFGEHKGAFSFWTEFGGVESAPKELVRDLKKLIEYMVSGTAAHPYDGLVAGSVA